MDADTLRERIISMAEELGRVETRFILRPTVAAKLLPLFEYAEEVTKAATAAGDVSAAARFADSSEELLIALLQSTTDWIAEDGSVDMSISEEQVDELWKYTGDVWPFARPDSAAPTDGTGPQTPARGSEPSEAREILESLRRRQAAQHP